MANTTGTHSYSTTLGLDPAGGTSYTAVAEVKKITFPNLKVGASDLSNLNSPSGFREFRAGLGDGGEATFTLTWTKAQYNTLITNLRVNLMGWKITFPLVGAEGTASKMEWKGHITDLSGEIPEDDSITCDVTVKVSGLPTFTQGA